MNLSGRDLSEVRRCRECGCHDAAPCLHNGTVPCYWVYSAEFLATDVDNLVGICSACDPTEASLYQTQVCPHCEGIGIGEIEITDGYNVDVVEVHCVRCRGIGGMNRADRPRV